MQVISNKRQVSKSDAGADFLLSARVKDPWQKLQVTHLGAVRRRCAKGGFKG